MMFLTVFTIKANALIFTFAENKGYFAQLKRLAEKLPLDNLVLAHGESTWVDPLYIAFDRKVIRIDLQSDRGGNTFKSWTAHQIHQQRPVYLLHEGGLRLPWQKENELDEVVLARSYSEPTPDPLPRKILREQRIIRLSKITATPSHFDYREVILGPEVVWGVEESGFHSQEWRDGEPVRWTKGAARLVVPLDKQRPPVALRVELASTGPRGTHLQVLVNDHKLFDGMVPVGGWSKTLGLGAIPFEGQTIIELRSGTFVPREIIRASNDDRVLGVLVQRIRLLESVKP